MMIGAFTFRLTPLACGHAKSIQLHTPPHEPNLINAIVVVLACFRWGLVPRPPLAATTYPQPVPRVGVVWVLSRRGAVRARPITTSTMVTVTVTTTTVGIKVLEPREGVVIVVGRIAALATRDYDRPSQDGASLVLSTAAAAATAAPVDCPGLDEMELPVSAAHHLASAAGFERCGHSTAATATAIVAARLRLSCVSSTAAATAAAAATTQDHIHFGNDARLATTGLGEQALALRLQRTQEFGSEATRGASAVSPRPAARATEKATKSSSFSKQLPSPLFAHAH
jgi:hypothetical protein